MSQVNELYFTVIDYISEESCCFGFAYPSYAYLCHIDFITVRYSSDGFTWSTAAAVPVTGGVRTPLALIQESNNTFSFFYTLTNSNGYEDVWTATVLLT